MWSAQKGEKTESVWRGKDTALYVVSIQTYGQLPGANVASLRNVFAEEAEKWNQLCRNAVDNGTTTM